MTSKHVISAERFTREDLKQIFDLTNIVKSGNFDKNALSDKIMATIFYEPSTRTRLSFESAILKLGGSFISTENAKEFSSAAKGETLEDTIRIINSYADLIVLRHFESGASDKAAKVSNVPIINAGDGNGEHPTQALLDLYTIFSKFSSKSNDNNIQVAMIGDLTYGRTVHSLSQLLSLYPKTKLIFCSPKLLAIPQKIKNYLMLRKTKFEETEDLNYAIKDSDVIYQTRIQKERFKSHAEYQKYKGTYIINRPTLKVIKPSSIIMHPLPRVDEIAEEVDSDPRAIYFEQAQNGVYVRMALLLFLFDKAHF